MADTPDLVAALRESVERARERRCRYYQAKGMHLFVGVRKPDGSTGECCHGCGALPKKEARRG